MKGPKRGTPRILPPAAANTVPIGTRLTIHVDLPPRQLSPNGAHREWYQVAPYKAKYRKDVWAAALDARNKAGWGTAAHVRVDLVFQTKVKRGDGFYHPEDVPNAVDAFKAGFDGLKDAGLFRDDSHRYMALGSVTIDPGTVGGVIITVESV